MTRASGSLLEGPAEDAVVQKNNGGAWFRFLRPLRLTEADLDTNSLMPDTVGFDSVGAPIVEQNRTGRWNVLLVRIPDNGSAIPIIGSRSERSDAGCPSKLTSVDPMLNFSGGCGFPAGLSPLEWYIDGPPE